MIDEKKLIEGIDIEVKALEGKDGKYYKGKIAGLRTAEALAKSIPKIGGWIPCSERLPECEWGAETEALLYQHKGTGSIEVGYYGRGGKFRDSYFRHYRNGTDGVDSKDVIAWQPLPEAYHG